MSKNVFSGGMKNKFVVPRQPQANDVQRARLMTIVQENPILVTHKFTNEMTFESYQAMWEEVKKELNLLGPAKELKNWQRYLTDQKTRVKKKKSALTRTFRKTGRGKADIPDLCAEDEKLLSVMGGQSVVKGDQKIYEFGFDSPADEPDSMNVATATSIQKPSFFDLVVKEDEECLLSPQDLQMPSPLTKRSGSVARDIAEIQKWNAAMAPDKLDQMKANMTAKLSIAPKSTLSSANNSGCGSLQKAPMQVRNPKKKMTQTDFDSIVGARGNIVEDQTSALTNIAKALKSHNELEVKKIKVFKTLTDIIAQFTATKQ